MQSAHPDPTLSPYQQGSGRVDVARAIHQSVLATPASLDFGGLPFPQQAPVTKTVTLTNTGDTAVTLNLAGELRDPSGTPLGDTLTIDPATITLPAHGSADVRATFDATNQPFGGYVGWLHATDPASNTELLHLAVAAKVQPPSHNLRLRPIPPAGWEGDNCACDNRHVWIIVRVDAPARPIIVDRVLPFVDVHVDDGVYLATTNFQHFNPQTGDLTFAQLLDPEVVVSGADRELVLDGNDAKLVAAEAPQPTEQTSAEQAFVRGTTFGGAWLIRWAEIYWSFLGKAALRVTPTKPVTIGSFRVATGFELIPDQARMRVNQPGRAELHASYANYHFQQPKLAFDGTVDLVDAGDGSAEAIAAAHVRGRLALLSGPTVVGPVPVNCTLGCGFPDGLARLRDAGALAAVAYLPEQGEGRPGWCGPYVFSADREDKCPQTMPLPVLTLGRGEGLGLHELASHEPVPIELHTQAGPISSTYRLRFDDTGAITSQPYHVHQGQLAILNNRYHGPTPTDLQRRTGILDAESVGVLTDVWLSGTREITEYVGPATPNLLWSTLLLANAVSARQDPDFFLRTGSNDELTTAELYPVADARTVDWFTPTTVTGFRVPPEILAGPLANSVPWTDSCRFCREARGLGAVPVLSSDDGTHFGAGLLFAALGFLPAIQYDAHLYREGQEVPSFNPFGPVLFDLREYPGPAQYRLAIHVRTSDPTIPIPPDISTTWYFTSQEPTSNKGIYNFNSPCDAQSPPDDRCRVERLLLLSYDYGSTLSIDNTSPAPGAAQIRVHVFQQAGAPASHILGLHEQVSFDHGAHWQPAEATVAGDGNYDVKFTYPTTARTGDTVSLRTQAWDDAGNRVQQTTLDVYQLTTR
jgi:hypothetical protein